MILHVLFFLVACRGGSDPDSLGNIQEGEAEEEETQENDTDEDDSSAQDQDTTQEQDTDEAEDTEEEDPSDTQAPEDTAEAEGQEEEDTGSIVYSDPLSELCHSDIEGWPSDWFLFEQAVLDEVNQYRQQGASCGALGYFEATTPLEMDPDFRCASRYHSLWMSENTYTHNSPAGDLGDDPPQRLGFVGYDGIWGENIYAAPSQPSTVVSGWMGSDENCATIMAEWWNVIGVGYYYDASSDHTHYWTQKFGFIE